MIVNQHHDNRLARDFLHRIQVPGRVHSHQPAVLPLARTPPLGAHLALHIRQLIESVLPPRAHELILLVIGRDIRARALLPVEIESVLFVVVVVCLAAEQRRRLPVREGLQRLSETALFGGFEGARVGDDAFGACVGAEADVGWDGVGHGWHVAGGAWGECAGRGFVGVVGVEGCSVVGGGRGEGDGVFRVCSRGVMLCAG